MKKLTACSTLLALMTLAAARGQTPPVGAAFDAEGRTLGIKAPGTAPFTSKFSARLELGGKKILLNSADGQALGLKVTTEPTPYGPATITTSTIHFEAEHLDLMLRLGEVPGVPGRLFQAGIRNGSTQTLQLGALTSMAISAVAPVSEWTREGGLCYLNPAYALSTAQDSGKPQLNLAVSGKPLSIAGKSYAKGLGTHANSDLSFALDGQADRFHALVGADDAGGGLVAFEVWVDGAKLFDSGEMKKGTPAEEVDIQLGKAKLLRLVVRSGPNGIGGAHADWADASILPSADAAQIVSPNAGLSFEGAPEDWLVTRLVGSSKPDEPGYVLGLSTLTKSLAISERGCFYRHDGVGFLIAPVGDPIAYLNTQVTYIGKGRAALVVSSDMSDVDVDAGETRWGQQELLLGESIHAALARQSDWVAKTHHARTDKGALDGWCSWYLKTSRITGEDVLGIVDAVEKSGGRLHPGVIQIDDGYQDLDGVWDANKKFPEGMPAYAKKIAAVGARPGLWMAITMVHKNAPWLKDPANIAAIQGKKFAEESKTNIHGGIGWIDPTHPAGKAYIADRIRHAVDRGFTYLKLDFNNVGNRGWYEKKRTKFEVMRDHYTNIRKAAGESTYILFCNEYPNRATYGLVDATRTSSDAWRGGIRNSINQILRSYDINGQCLAIDNDCYYLATDLESKELGKIGVRGGWPMIQTYASMMGLSSGAAFTSDLWHHEMFKPHLRLVEQMTPPAREQTQVLDLGISEEWPRLISHITRPWGNSTVALLWNPAKEEKAVTLDFAKAGLSSEHPYAVWSFWENKFLGLASKNWTTPALPVSGCQHLVLTELHGSDPVVIGSNFHISSGAAEIKNVVGSGSGIAVELTDAGARDGELFIYSRQALQAGEAIGCSLKSVESAGEHVWKVRLEGRQNGKAQRVSLNLAK